MNFKTLPSRHIYGGIQYFAIFPNGYGASIVKHKYSYGEHLGKYELAVLHEITGTPFNDDFRYSLCYSTSITDDVLVNLSGKEVNNFLVKISEL